MSNLNYTSTLQYVTYQCTVCNRTRDIRQDNLRAFINKCTITQHCIGKLSPIFTKTLRSVLATSENISLQDWIANNTVPSNPEPSTPIILNAQKSIMTIAVRESLGTLNYFFLKFNMNSSILNYLEYSYSMSNFTDVLGNDTSGKLLKFTTADTLLIYVNGIQLQDTEYSVLFNGTLGYGISLDTKIFVQSNVRILVFTPSTIQTTENVKFKEHLTSNLSSAWSNVTKVWIEGERYRLYSTDNLAVLPLNTRLNLLPGLNSLDISQAKILLANPNYTVVDRNLTQIVSLDNLISTDNFLTISVQNANYMIQYNNISTESITPIQVDISSVLSIASEIPSDLTSVSTASNINEVNANHILGVI